MRGLQVINASQLKQAREKRKGLATGLGRKEQIAEGELGKEIKRDGKFRPICRDGGVCTSGRSKLFSERMGLIYIL